MPLLLPTHLSMLPNPPTLPPTHPPPHPPCTCLPPAACPGPPPAPGRRRGTRGTGAEPHAPRHPAGGTRLGGGGRGRGRGFTHRGVMQKQGGRVHHRHMNNSLNSLNQALEEAWACEQRRGDQTAQGAPAHSSARVLAAVVRCTACSGCQRSCGMGRWERSFGGAARGILLAVSFTRSCPTASLPCQLRPPSRPLSHSLPPPYQLCQG